MSELLNGLFDFGWASLFLTALLLFGLYMALRFLYKVSANIHWFGTWQSSLTKFFQVALTLFEPLAILLLGASFVLISPTVNGAIVLVILVAGFPQLRNYVNGRMLQLSQHFSEGMQINIAGIKGLIIKAGRLGVQIRTSEGLHFINNTTLMSDGFLIVSGETIGNLFYLNIHPEEVKEKEDYYHQLKDLLAGSPYLDKSNPLKLIEDRNRVHHFSAELLLHREEHLNSLTEALAERGFMVEVLKY